MKAVAKPTTAHKQHAFGAKTYVTTVHQWMADPRQLSMFSVKSLESNCLPSMFQEEPDDSSMDGLSLGQSRSRIYSITSVKDKPIPSLIITASSDSFENFRSDVPNGGKKDSTVVDVSQARKKSGFWERVAKRPARTSPFQMNRGQVKSARRVRQMRKKASVTSKVSRPRSNQEELALSVIDGDLKTVEEIVEAYISLYGSKGYQSVLNFRY